MAYVYSTTTTDSDPGSGILRFNNSTFASITQVFLDDNNVAGTDIQAWLATLDDSTAAIKGSLRIFKTSDSTIFRIFDITALLEATGYWKVTVTPVVSAGTLVNADGVVVSFVRFGDASNIASEIDAATVSTTMSVTDRIAATISGTLRYFTYQTIRDAIKGYYDSVVATLTNKSIDASANTLTNVNTSALSNDAVSNTKLSNMAQATVKGRQAGSGTGDPEDLTAAQLVTIIEAQALYALLAGRSGGQTLRGGTASGDDLTLMSTNNATKGSIFFGSSGYDEVNNRLGIKVSDPEADLEVVATGTSAARGFIVAQHNSGAQGALFVLRKSRNTRASPATVVTGDFAGVFFSDMFDGTDYVRSAGFGFRANGTIATGSVPQDFILSVGSAGAGSLENEVLRVVGATQFSGLGTSSPQGKFQIYDGKGSSLFVSKTSVNGTAQTIIPDGTGDVLRRCIINAVIWATDNSMSGGLTISIANNALFQFFLDSPTNANAVTFSVSSAGALTVQRTLGSKSFDVSAHIVWL